jgi:signal transduction histidine kinase
MSLRKNILSRAWSYISEYPAVFSAIAIYMYYLVTSLNYFEKAKEKTTFLDYVLQFDSLIWMWLAAVAFVQVQKYRKLRLTETSELQVYQREMELQKAQNEMLNDITLLLQDSINNPLAIISLKTREIRKKFENDSDMIRLLEAVEGAMRRIEQTIRDLKGFQSQKIFESSADRLRKTQTDRQ